MTGDRGKAGTVAGQAGCKRILDLRGVLVGLVTYVMLEYKQYKELYAISIRILNPPHDTKYYGINEYPRNEEEVSKLALFQHKAELDYL